MKNCVLVGIFTFFTLDAYYGSPLLPVELSHAVLLLLFLDRTACYIIFACYVKITNYNMTKVISFE
jgi:hypothetical protein